jgi:hypothetical protein
MGIPGNLGVQSYERDVNKLSCTIGNSRDGKVRGLVN